MSPYRSNDPVSLRLLLRRGPVAALAASLALGALPGCPASTPAGEEGTYQGEVWADNWSSMSVDGEQVMEDSVSITTERSFNEEVFTFTATRPFVVAATLKDFKENDSGLEYIGEPNQQMGDGGYIAQISDAGSGEVVGVTSSAWRCLVTHEAPLDTGCEDSADPLTDCSWEITDEPDGWQEPDFDDSGWDAATEWSEADVDPKDGYDLVNWDPDAKLIWTGDLETHNTVLCRFTVE